MEREGRGRKIKGERVTKGRRKGRGGRAGRREKERTDTPNF